MYLGIDLGTSNSAIVGNRAGRLDLFKAVSGEDVLASVVMTDRHGGRYVGKRAYDQLRTAPQGIAARFKRLLGTSTTLPFGPAADSITPEEASAEVLRQLLKQMRAGVGDEAVAGAIVTVPAAFNQMQSEATIRAARAAGLERVGLLQEPIAAALACLENPAARNGLFLIYDLGGGTFDVALVRAIDGAVSIEAHEGINMLGGSDFDRMLVDALVKPWLQQTFALTGDWQRRPEYRRLLALATANAEAAKVELSTADQAIIFVSEHDARALDEAGRELFVEVAVARADLEALVADKIDQSIALCRKVVTDHGYTTADVSKVVLIGGPSRMPIVRQRVPAELGIATDLDVDPMTAVARGAAIFAESRDWSGDEAQAKPARVQEAAPGAQVSFDYEARTTRERARIRVTATKGASGLRVSARASDGRDYGERLVDESPVFVIQLADGETSVAMEVTDAGGAPLPGSSRTLTVTRVAAAAAGAPCTSTISVKVEDGDGVRAINVLEPLVRKGETLPLKGTKTLRATRPISPGSDDAIDVELFEQADGVQEPEANLLIGSFHLSGRDLPGYAAPLRSGEQVILHWSVDDSQLIRCSIELPEQGLHLADHSFYADELARVDFGTNGAAFATDALIAADKALDDFGQLDAAVRARFASELARLRTRIAGEFTRLDGAREADTYRSIAEEARLLRQDISRLRHRPELRLQMVRADLYRVEASARALLASLSQDDRAQFEQQRATAEQALDDERFRVAERAIEAMEGVLRLALSRSPDYYLEGFRWLQSQRHLSTDPARFDALVTRGRAAADARDINELREVCHKLGQTLNLPREQTADVTALAGLRR
ncbi:molecular chaperone DnaK [Sphingomonas guangdongensis]|uniref:Molecular chaperone DnaK n=1 Tax=Sphingomonas guangdongensis TaxID=1141890 RepID=A0A285QWP7_9SPHN|nr:Hsp70 family protein [Sphingomonas guangdongensis]SOB86395.1 molecular chaperone DnaK [Sphingomonas guangdongensis]